ncbi:M50 family metallopeptidase [Legionella dresdenensis]|uniref:M50 family metallopeptidase n=1 Tax=Legionella dresdenensis TaxID=450200 RepID=A0ABV8CGQ4_9GAMM
MLSGFFAFVLMMILVIGLHEAGHAIAAYLAGVKIQRISIGFGKPVMSWFDKQQREWVWAVWPLGGYVRLLNSRIQKVRPDELPFCFDKQPVSVRCLILVSGALMNFFIAWIALTIYFMAGHTQQAPVISRIVPGTIAAHAGLTDNDRILAVAGVPVNSWQETAMQFIQVWGKDKVALTVAGEGATRHLTLDLNAPLAQKKKNFLAILGIEPSDARELMAGESLPAALSHAWYKQVQLIKFFLISIKQLVFGVIPFSYLIGPLGLLTASVNSFLLGIAAFMYFIACLSISVGLVNLLPIPGLDGGSILLAMIEKVRNKPVSVALEVLLYRLSFIFFCVFLIQLVLNDLIR